MDENDLLSISLQASRAEETSTPNAVKAFAASGLHQGSLCQNGKLKYSQQPPQDEALDKNGFAFAQ